jgi:hypothetical protein
MLSTRPKLRALDIRPYEQDGQAYFLLRDPLQISEALLAVPQPLGPLLALCDGTWDVEMLGAILNRNYGLRFEPGVLDGVVNALDEAGFLDNERFARARLQALADYRNAPFRPPALAGVSYPADPTELRALLDGYMAEAGDVASTPAEARGLVSPHIDYGRGGAVYARVWKRAAEMARAADLVILLGTDHYSDEPASLTLTRQHYATPFGVLPTARDTVDRLADALGPEAAYRGELRHRGEHSLELVAVWLHYLRGDRPVEVVPILTGSFGGFVRAGASPAEDPKMRALLGALRKAVKGRRALVVASGDLSHVGPAFGGAPLDDDDKQALQTEDAQVIGRMCAGDAEGFYSVIQRVEDRNNICGLSPVYALLRLLGETEGECVAYEVCPAGEQTTSVVSVCGVVLE